jgi:hypothetical protein
MTMHIAEIIIALKSLALMLPLLAEWLGHILSRAARFLVKNCEGGG